MSEVAVVVGTGGLGLACARRVGAGKHLFIGDRNAHDLEANRAMLTAEGYTVSAREIDVTDPVSVAAFGAAAAEIGAIRTLVHTAGLSPHMADPEKILHVNLVGVVNVLDLFMPLMPPGSAAVVIASSAGYLSPIPVGTERKLALDPVDTLLATARTIKGWNTGLGAYWISKRGNQLRVEAAATVWGRLGSRVVSVSPGIISTQMTKFERDQGSLIGDAVENTPVGRIGVAGDIAAAVAWVTGPEASFVNGVDILVDGGMVSALRWTAYETQDPTE